MKVKDLMTKNVRGCGPDTNLAAAAKLMWDTDCGVLPVVNSEGQVLGMITDRDICMACATKNKPPSEITAGEIFSKEAYRCKVSDDVRTALGIMEREQVRRLPVVDENGVLQGLISMNDFILLAGEASSGKPPVISCEDVAKTLKAISAHRMPMAA
ncbi:MAG TPA: CBS domain-containing protein [Nitrospira sp.]|nr:CBS domain-containing protein [Nitrospira sp.]